MSSLLPPGNSRGRHEIPAGPISDDGVTPTVDPSGHPTASRHEPGRRARIRRARSTGRAGAGLASEPDRHILSRTAISLQGPDPGELPSVLHPHHVEPGVAETAGEPIPVAEPR